MKEPRGKSGPYASWPCGGIEYDRSGKRGENLIPGVSPDAKLYQSMVCPCPGMAAECHWIPNQTAILPPESQSREARTVAVTVRVADTQPVVGPASA